MGCYDFAEYLKQRIDEIGISRKACAARAGISRSALYKILSGDVLHVRLTTLEGLARALKVDYLELIQLLTNRKSL